MEHLQQDQRCASTQQFQQSLTQLEDILKVNYTSNEQVTELETGNSIRDQSNKNSSEIYLAALEDAVADIEQYLAQKNRRK
jgi:predicted DNA-binding ArsR family transcriptional regulator